jgi:ribose transport system permease protein
LLVSGNAFGVMVSLLTLVLVIGTFRPAFLSAASLTNLGQQAALYGVMALGMVFLLSMREIDLSVGSIYALCVITAAVLMRSGLDPWLGALVGLVLGVALGACNGLLANVLGLPTIIVTLGSIQMFRGLTFLVSDGRGVSGLPLDHPFFTIFGGRLLGLPMAIWAAVVLTVFLHVLYRWTRFGFLVRAIGSNEEAARMSGIPIERIRLLALMLMGGLCGIAGMLTLAFFQAADPNLGVGWELLVIASAIIGGTGLAGGSGTVVGALLGALIISVIRSGLIQFGVTANWSTFVTGAVIIAAVAIDAFVRRRRSAK